MAGMTAVEAAFSGTRQQFTANCGCKATLNIGGSWVTEHCGRHSPQYAPDLIAMAERMVRPAPHRPASIVDLWATLPPARAIILGKGPSLSRFVSADYAEWVVFAINEAVTAKPGGMPARADYFVFTDDVAQTIVDIPDGTIPIGPTPRRASCDALGYWFRVGRDLPVETGSGGATGRAAAILGEWVRRTGRAPLDVLFVGCDSWDNYDEWTDEGLYADCMSQCVGFRHRNYTLPNRHLDKVLSFYKAELKPRWFHREIAVGREYSKAV